MPVAESLSDTRVLIPRVRRRLEGPASVSGSAAVAAGALTDEQVNALIADAIAGVIFYSGGLFGHTLVVEERDPDYLAPIAWSVDPELTEPEAVVIDAQAALDYFFQFTRGMKTSEEISDEGQTWSWTKSAALLQEQFKSLRDARDAAIAQLSADNPNLESWTNFLAVRDAQTDAIIEPWLYGGGGGQYLDPRFGSY